MSWSETTRFARFFGALALAGLTAGCFQPLYAEHPTAGRRHWPFRTTAARSTLRRSMRPAAAGSPGSASSVRNELIYDLTGGSGGVSPTTDWM